MATAGTHHQDMPPEGGYGPINYARIPAKSYFRGKMCVCCFHKGFNVKHCVDTMYMQHS